MYKVTKASTYDSEPLTLKNIRRNVIGLDIEVPLLNGSRQTYINFDNAATTPPLRPVYDTVQDFMHWYSSVHRGTGLKSVISTYMYEEAHHIVREFVGADPEADVVLLVNNSTEALNKLARRIPLAKDDLVLATAMEHHSNDLPWRSVAGVEHVRVDERGALDIDHLDALLRKHGGNVRLVAVSGASNVTGYVNPVHNIAEKAHNVGAEIVVDAAQLAPHRPIQMRVDDEARRIDYLVLSEHKMYAPYGSGALVGPRETFAQGDPDTVGGGTVDLVTLDHVEWAQLPEKEEAGSPNVVGAVAMAQSMLCLQHLGMEISGTDVPVVVDSPSGPILARARVTRTDDGHPRVESVAIQLESAFAFLLEQPLQVPELGEITTDVVFAGGFFVMVSNEELCRPECSSPGPRELLALTPENASELIRLGMAITEAANRQLEVRHPTRPYMDTIDVVEFYDPRGDPQGRGKNAVIYGEAHIDRSACGTGTSAKMALLHRKGELGVGVTFVNESPLGSTFEGCILKETYVDSIPAIVPEIRGRAHVTGLHRFVLTPEDPFPEGFLI